MTENLRAKKSEQLVLVDISKEDEDRNEDEKQPENNGKADIGMITKAVSKFKKKNTKKNGKEEESYEEFVRKKTMVKTENGLNYSAMRDRLTKHHPHMIKDGEKVKYPV
mmetsp:Transcript_21636/g.21290  ORF Transcript_21636/g.21290 Transcript_21636/m.21290 type:complete len:109 (+) Transcript_21636:460-786(+)